MLLRCENKGCYAEDNHLLDEATNTVYCIECGGEVEVLEPTKRALKSIHQIKRKVQKGLTFKCVHCGQTDRPVVRTLSGAHSIATCAHCGKQMDIPGPFIEAIKSLGRTDEQDEE